MATLSPYLLILGQQLGWIRQLSSIHPLTRWAPRKNVLPRNVRLFIHQLSLPNISLQVDLNCIVTTLVRCFMPEFELMERSKSDMQVLLQQHQVEVTARHVRVCLELLSLQSSSAAEESVTMQNALAA